VVAEADSVEVVNMLRHLGMEKLPETMLISLARQRKDEQMSC
jgi:hypothetical protein